MTALSLPSGLFDRYFTAARRWTATPRRAAVPDTPHEAARARRREFVQEMLMRNPGAFSSDLDVQSMMLCYPDRF